MPRKLPARSTHVTPPEAGRAGARGRAAGGLRLTLPAGTPRNPVVQALAARGRSGAAGQHGPDTGARRRAENMALKKALHTGSHD